MPRVSAFASAFVSSFSSALAFYHGAWVRVNSFESQVNSNGNGILGRAFYKTENSILTLTFTPKSANIYLKERFLPPLLPGARKSGENANVNKT